MEHEAYKEASLIIKEQKKLEEDYEILDDIKFSLPLKIVFEYHSNYQYSIKPHPDIFPKVIEIAMSLVEERQKELEQQLKHL